MILSFHPCFATDKNIICAGRKPGYDELEQIKLADAVILSQGCSETLYRMAKENCKNVFPDYDARFDYPGKMGQILLFQKTGVAHPSSKIFSSLSHLCDLNGDIINEQLLFSYPFVIKLDWGGEGETVYLVKTPSDLKSYIAKIEEYEKSGQKGFILQEFIESGNKSLRIVVIGNKMISYWRVQKNPDNFCAGLSQGATIDFEMERALIRLAEKKTKMFCNRTGINLAGFDFIFSINDPDNEPLFLEINYFFGRSGLGGSEKYYRILNKEIRNWLKNLNL
ncbi:MAG: ATP-grasp domain-containing protein [Proteobacteria bacterium]|nr:ATP-grasp domain-containing protein [Pseudomonadota bacterium]